MKTYKRQTLDHKGNWTDVYECEHCKARSIYKERILYCCRYLKEKTSLSGNMGEIYTTLEIKNE